MKWCSVLMNSVSHMLSRAWHLNPSRFFNYICGRGVSYGGGFEGGVSMMDQLTFCVCHTHLLYSWTERTHIHIKRWKTLGNRISDRSRPLKNASCLWPSLDINSDVSLTFVSRSRSSCRVLGCVWNTSQPYCYFCNVYSWHIQITYIATYEITANKVCEAYISITPDCLFI